MVAGRAWGPGTPGGRHTGRRLRASRMPQRLLTYLHRTPGTAESALHRATLDPLA
jgi:hypothetical protein